MTKSPFRGPALLLAVLTLTLCSCKEHLQLFLDKAQMEEEMRLAQAETQATDAKFATLGQPFAYAAQQLEQQIAEAEKTVAAQALVLAELDSRVAGLDQALKTFRPRADAYKTAHLK